MSGFVTVKRHAEIAAAERERARLRRAVRAAAYTQVEAALKALLAGCEGALKDEVVAAILAIGADLYAAHEGPASACAGLGHHAHRVGGGLVGKTSSLDEAERLFRAKT